MEILLMRSLYGSNEQPGLEKVANHLEAAIAKRVKRSRSVSLGRSADRGDLSHLQAVVMKKQIVVASVLALLVCSKFLEDKFLFHSCLLKT